MFAPEYGAVTAVRKHRLAQARERTENALKHLLRQATDGHAASFTSLQGALRMGDPHDATTQIGPEKRHPWGEPLGRPAELEARIDARWAELGLADIGTSDPDPALFGYTLEHVLERLADRAAAAS